MAENKQSTNKQITIGLLGLGSVGTGVVKVVEKRAGLIRNRSGYELRIKSILVRNLDKRRSIDTGRYELTTNFERILDDPEIEIVIELLGGTEPARSYIKRALENGKHVVTANKAVISKHGPELFEAAARNNVNLAFEASVCGCIPIIKSIRESLVANSISSLSGIVNGTTNYILTRMSKEGKSYESALQEAQQKGFAEPDPSFDVSGKDAAQKIAILAMLAFNTAINPDAIYVEGIQDITGEDMVFAEKLGYAVKLLGFASSAKNGEGNEALDIRVHPVLLRKHHPLANIDGELNAIHINGDLVGEQTFHGKGAGQLPTASTVVSDVIEVVKGVNPVKSFGAAAFTDINDLEFVYYLRLPVVDRPGVLYRIAKVIAASGISIAELEQPSGKDVTSLIIKTHRAKERMMRHAFNELNKLAVVRKGAVLIRVQD